MIGNDIVDLQVSKFSSKVRRLRFINKAFSEKEKEAILKPANTISVLWRIWSMKESAYKAYCRLGGETFHDPKRIECTLTNSNSGTVRIGDRCFKTQTRLSDDYVHTIAFSKDIIEVVSECFRIDNTSYTAQHKACKEALLNELTEEMNGKPGLDLVKNEVGMPHVLANGNRLGVTCSISHHGRYGAYAYMKRS